MFAEVMAVLDIPASPRESAVNRRLADERARREAANVIPLRRLAFARSAAAVGVAAAIGLGLVTVSAYAGVLPDDIQKVAHSIINAPQPEHHVAPSTTGSTNGNGGNGNGGNATSTSASTGAHGARPSDPAASGAPSATRTATVPTPGNTPTHTNTPNPHSTSSPSKGGGKGHKTPPASSPTSPHAGSTQSGSTGHHNG